MAVANSIDSLHKNVYVSHELGDFHRSQIIEMTDFVQTMTFTGLNKKKLSEFMVFVINSVEI